MEGEFTSKNLLIVGLGLMGSAFAQGSRSLGFSSIWALDHNEEVLRQALEEGLIDRGSSSAEELLPQADVVLVCLNLGDAIAFITDNMDRFKSGALITDIVGVKQDVVDKVLPVLRQDVDFIPGHPMAGREKGGPLFSTAAIFLGKNYILTPLSFNKEEHHRFLRQWIQDLGFGRIIETDPQTHDARIAFTSQLCHVIAASMVDISEDAVVTQFEGGSFQDMTRIAMINSAMWAELFVANKEELTSVLDRFIQSLTFFKEAILNEETGTIVERFDIISRKREDMGK
jgi:prephenate dehydrogenase